MFKNAFANLQKVGKSLMLPVSVLPIAGILLGVGSANFSWLPAVVSHVMAEARRFRLCKHATDFCDRCRPRLYQ